jgi:hypothetical protein
MGLKSCLKAAGGCRSWRDGETYLFEFVVVVTGMGDTFGFQSV